MRSAACYILLLAIAASASATHRRAVGHPSAYPLNHIFASHIYDSDAGVHAFAVELRVSAWPESDRPWQDPAWRQSTGLSDAATFPVRVWRRRGDYVCAVQTFIVPLYPDAQYELPVDTTLFRGGDAVYIEPSDAFTISTYRRDSSVASAEWILITSVKTTADYDWREPRLTPPWGNIAPFVDCSKPED